MRLVVAAILCAALVLVGSASLAYNCPVVIKQAEDTIKKAEAGKVSPETRQLIDEAKKFLAEAKAHHGNAKTKRDHGDSVRKAKTAIAYAEEAIILQNPYRAIGGTSPAFCRQRGLHHGRFVGQRRRPRPRIRP